MYPNKVHRHLRMLTIAIWFASIPLLWVSISYFKVHHLTAIVMLITGIAVGAILATKKSTAAFDELKTTGKFIGAVQTLNGYTRAYFETKSGRWELIWVHATASVVCVIIALVFNVLEPVIILWGETMGHSAMESRLLKTRLSALK